jgi:hypothetical protein
MTRLFPRFAFRWAGAAILCLVLGPLVPNTFGAEAAPAGQLYHNEDCTNFFWFNDNPEGKAGEIVDRYVDVIADAGVTVLLCNTNARRTNYQSRVWEAFWDGYDPAGPDDQPFLAPMRRDAVAAYRKGLGNMLAVHRQGIDYPARMAQRCRQRGISPWISLRMNDCHENDIADHPFHGSFWKKNPQFRRQNCPGYFATCLDYAHPEVRDLYKALIVETLDRYDIDGLELDFMREPYLFSAGKEAEGAPILTAWIRDVRKLTEAAAARRGHPVRLGVRVPSRPETAKAMGLEAIDWAKEGLIDLLVATPRWATTEFDMPLEQWRELLGTSKVTLAGGLEVLYRPCPGGEANTVSPELDRGAAAAVLSRGADTVYLFNHFQNGVWPPDVYRDLLKSMRSLDTLLKLPRSVGITYRDITGPGEAYQPPLPAAGKELAFRMRPGPIPEGRATSVLLEFAPGEGAAMSVPNVTVNGQPCEVAKDETPKPGIRVIRFNVPAAAVKVADVHEIKAVTKDDNALTVRRVEMRVGE